MMERNERCKCLLCKCERANKTGSHIVPSFLMKRINSHEGCLQRDHEVGFEIRSSGVKTYFGRSIYREVREEYTDDQSMMESRFNPDMLDYILCSDCESCFSQLESSYAKSIDLKGKLDSLITNNKSSGLNAMLFWCSILWRCSVTCHLGNSLNADFEKKLRRVLLKKSIDGTNLQYALFRCFDYSKRYPGATVAIMESKKDTAILMVDEYLLITYNGNPAAKKKSTFLGGRVQFTPSQEVVFNNGIDKERISCMPEDVFEQFLLGICYYAASQMDIRGKINRLHSALYGVPAPPEIMEEILAEMSKAKLADVYTISNYAKSFKNVIDRHSIGHQEQSYIEFRDSKRDSGDLPILKQ